MYKFFFKRFFDILLSIVGLTLFSPLLIITVLFLFIANNGKVFFLQQRPGKNAKIFSILKFRTMNEKKDAEGNLLDDSQRITKIGMFIRRTSLDEIPQLVNVLLGDMSIIGPRPLLIEYLSLYNTEQAHRHAVRPGITGWAQINGRNAINWEHKFKLDVWYVNHIDFCLDMKIIWLTVKKVILKEGISSDTSATMERFTGNNKN